MELEAKELHATVSFFTLRLNSQFSLDMEHEVSKDVRTFVSQLI